MSETKEKRNLSAPVKRNGARRVVAIAKGDTAPTEDVNSLEKFVVAAATNAAQQQLVEVALGLESPELPEWVWCDGLFKRELKEPPILIEGILHRGSKMVLGGTSKSCKTWALMDMALSVACGVPWWGNQTMRAGSQWPNSTRVE